MIDFKVDLHAIRQAKELKTAMVQRLKQIDFDNSGLITLDSLTTIAERYGIHLSHADLNEIRDKYRKTPSQMSQACKVDYNKVLNDIKLRIDHDGKVSWTIASASVNESPYRVKIQKLTSHSTVTTDDVVSLMSHNHLSPSVTDGLTSKKPLFNSNIRQATKREKILSKAGIAALEEPSDMIDFIMMSPQ